MYAQKYKSVHPGNARLRHPPIARQVVGLAREHVAHLRLAGPRQHRPSPAVGERPVVPAPADAQSVPLAVHPQTRGDNHVCLLERCRTQVRTRRFRNAAPGRTHGGPAVESRPIRLTAKHWQPHLPATRHERIHEGDGVRLTLDAHIRRAHPGLFRKPFEKATKPLGVLAAQGFRRTFSTRPRA